MAEHEGYYLITCGEDGDVFVRPYSKADLLARLARDEADGTSLDFLSTVSVVDPQEWRGKSLLIKGRLVQPLVKQVVTEFDVP